MYLMMYKEQNDDSQARPGKKRWKSYDSTRRVIVDANSRRKLSMYKCDRAWCSYWGRGVDADGDEGAVANKLVGRLRMNGTNLWGWSVASHYFTRATGADLGATRWSSNPCWPMGQPDNLCYLTRPLEICLWYNVYAWSRFQMVAAFLASYYSGRDFDG